MIKTTKTTYCPTNNENLLLPFFDFAFFFSDGLMLIFSGVNSMYLI